MNKGKAFFAALAAALLLAAGDAQAAFRYSVSVSSVNPIVFGSSSYTTNGATVTPPAPDFLIGTQFINLAQTTQASTAPVSAPDSTTSPLNLVVTITNAESGISGNITVNNTLTITRSDQDGAVSFLTNNLISPPSIVLGAFTYSLSNISYTPPTIGSAPQNGGISALLTEANVIPEPASLVMLGTGVLALGGLGVVRRRRQG